MILGFCFSFPTQQTAIDHGTLIKWVKGFTNPGAEGQDVMKLLRDAFHRKVGTLGRASCFSCTPKRSHRHCGKHYLTWCQYTCSNSRWRSQRLSTMRWARLRRRSMAMHSTIRTRASPSSSAQVGRCTAGPSGLAGFFEPPHDCWRTCHVQYISPDGLLCILRFQAPTAATWSSSATSRSTSTSSCRAPLTWSSTQ
jgi:Hexokinase